MKPPAAVIDKLAGARQMYARLTREARNGDGIAEVESEMFYASIRVLEWVLEPMEKKEGAAS